MTDEIFHATYYAYTTGSVTYPYPDGVKDTRYSSSRPILVKNILMSGFNFVSDQDAYIGVGVTYPNGVTRHLLLHFLRPMVATSVSLPTPVLLPAGCRLHRINAGGYPAGDITIVVDPEPPLVIDKLPRGRNLPPFYVDGGG